MTGPSDGLDEEGTDPLESLLRHPVGILPPPPGSFDRIRRTAARRRVLRAAAGGGLAVAAVAGVLYVAGTLHLPEGRHTPQATSPPPPSLSRPPASATAAPSPTDTPTVAGIQPTAPAPGGSAGAPAGVPSAALPSPSATASAAPMCATSQLSAALGGGDAGAGQVYRYLVITNSSRTTCHLTGFPGLSLLDASGRQIGAAATYDHLAYTPVVLAPGASASDTIHTVNRQTNNPGECLAASTSLRIYPPGNRDALVIPGTVTNCDSTLTVTPLTSGSTGNPAN